MVHLTAQERYMGKVKSGQKNPSKSSPKESKIVLQTVIGRPDQASGKPDQAPDEQCQGQKTGRNVPVAIKLKLQQIKHVKKIQKKMLKNMQHM